jgi:MFS superfamily sulfate permease-like transporter
VKVLGRVPGTGVFRDVARYPDAEQYPGIKVLRVDESITFASCMSFKEQVLRIATAGGSHLPSHVILEASGAFERPWQALSDRVWPTCEPEVCTDGL